MKYLEALQTILEGMENDNAREIEAGAEMLIASVGDVPLSECERIIATHLTKRVADLGGCDDFQSKPLPPSR